MRYLLITTTGALVNTSSGTREAVEAAGAMLAKRGIASFAGSTDAPLSAGPVALSEVARFGAPNVDFKTAYERWTARQSQGRGRRGNMMSRAMGG